MFVDETTDFRLVPLVRNAFLTKNFDVLQEIKDKVHFWPEGPDFFKNIPEDEHMVYWTENHLSGILSTEYLIAQHLNQPLLHNRLEQFLESRLRYGSSEYLSVAYQAYTLAGILNIVDFCTDEKLKHMATQFCNMIVEQYAHVINPFTGNVASAGGRMYAYMRHTTDKLKISPLCYLLVGQPERMDQFDQYKFTLAYALKTTTYKIPDRAFQIIQKRREPGTHYSKMRLTAPFISTDEPIWICWTYGHYTARPVEAVRFMYDHGLHYHHHFRAAISKVFGLGNVSVVLMQLTILLFYPIISLLLYMFGTVSWLTDVELETVTMVQNKSVVVITAAVPKNTRGRPAAQQFPAQILVNDLTVYINFGQIISGVKKEMSGMSMMPHVDLTADHDTSILHIMFLSYNPVFAFRSRKDALEVNGLEEVQNKYPEWTITVAGQTPKEIKLIVRKTNTQV
jgi:hypothetical protein